MVGSLSEPSEGIASCMPSIQLEELSSRPGLVSAFDTGEPTGQAQQGVHDQDKQPTGNGHELNPRPSLRSPWDEGQELSFRPFLSSLLTPIKVTSSQMRMLEEEEEEGSRVELTTSSKVSSPFRSGIVRW